MALGLFFAYGCITTIALSALWPLKEKHYVFLKFSDKREQVVTVLPMYEESEGMELHQEGIVREYVNKRESIDLHTDGDRWASLYLFHDEEIETDFSDFVRADNPKSPLHQFREQNMMRKIIILSSRNLAPTAPDVYQVEWVAEDCSTLHDDNYKVLSRQEYVSTITIELQEQNKTLDDRLINPFGVTVINYTVAKKNN